jgi:hypothetical protein
MKTAKSHVEVINWRTVDFMEWPGVTLKYGKKP